MTMLEKRIEVAKLVLSDPEQLAVDAEIANMPVAKYKSGLEKVLESLEHELVVTTIKNYGSKK